MKLCRRCFLQKGPSHFSTNEEGQQSDYREKCTQEAVEKIKSIPTTK